MDSNLKAAIESGDFPGMLSIVVDTAEQGILPATMREDLASFFKASEDKTRDAIIHGFLEHIFEVPGMAEQFEDWKKDPVLGPAYEEAKVWSDSINAKRSFLTSVAEACLDKISKNGQKPRIGPPIIGVDSISLEWETEGGDSQELVIDCGYEFMETLISEELTDVILESLAHYAVNPLHWIEGEYAPDQKWVLLDNWAPESG